MGDRKRAEEDANWTQINTETRSVDSGSIVAEAPIFIGTCGTHARGYKFTLITLQLSLQNAVVWTTV